MSVPAVQHQIDQRRRDDRVVGGCANAPPPLTIARPKVNRGDPAATPPGSGLPWRCLVVYSAFCCGQYYSA